MISSTLRYYGMLHVFFHSNPATIIAHNRRWMHQNERRWCKWVLTNGKHWPRRAFSFETRRALCVHAGVRDMQPWDGSFVCPRLVGDRIFLFDCSLGICYNGVGRERPYAIMEKLTADIINGIIIFIILELQLIGVSFAVAFDSNLGKKRRVIMGAFETSTRLFWVLFDWSEPRGSRGTAMYIDKLHIEGLHPTMRVLVRS